MEQRKVYDLAAYTYIDRVVAQDRGVTGYSLNGYRAYLHFSRPLTREEQLRESGDVRNLYAQSPLFKAQADAEEWMPDGFGEQSGAMNVPA